MDREIEKMINFWLATAARRHTNGHYALPKYQEPKNRTRKVRPQQDELERSALRFLAEAGIAKIRNGVWLLSIHFTSFLSANRTGLAFVAFGNGQEALIFPENRNGALHRDQVLIELVSFSRNRFIARVVAITKPASSEYLARTTGKARWPGFFHAELIDLPDRPQVLVQSKSLPGELLYVRRNAIGKKLPFTDLPVFSVSDRPVRESRAGDLERLRLRFNLPGEFPAKVVPQRRLLQKLVREESKNPARRKIGDDYIFTIDGDDAKDFDDAICCVRTPDGFRLDVHIADVGFFVGAKTPLFAEALARGNSYYLAGSVIPMLPEILSNEFCSLKPRTWRLAFSVRMFFDLSGNMLRYELFRSWIFIRKRYTYKEAASVLQRKNNPLADAMALARILIERRDRKGRIDLNMAELKAIYDKEGRLLSLEREERLDSHRLVEECMLSANQAVADYALKNHIPILHRNHEDMPAEKLEKLNRFLQKFAPRLKLRSSEQQEINRVLGSDRLNPIREIFQILLLRSFMQANYTPDSRGHWGLAFSAYAHFTSPIRRFADLVTHLQIAAHLDNRGSHFTRAELEHFGREASRLERVAFEAERADKKLLAVRALRDRVGEIFSAWLSGFTSEVLFIQLVDFPVEGEIPAIEADRYGSVRILDDFTVYVGKLGRTLSLGDPLQVELLRADPVEISLHFRPARAKN